MDLAWENVRVGDKVTCAGNVDDTTITGTVKIVEGGYFTVGLVRIWSGYYTLQDLHRAFKTGDIGYVRTGDIDYVGIYKENGYFWSGDFKMFDPRDNVKIVGNIND